MTTRRASFPGIRHSICRIGIMTRQKCIFVERWLGESVVKSDWKKDEKMAGEGNYTSGIQISEDYSSSSPQPSSICSYCRNRGLPANHSLVQCQVRECLTCHKTAPGHLQSNCPRAPSTVSSKTQSSRSRYPSNSGQFSRSATVASEGSSPHNSIDSTAPSFFMDGVESIIN
ncbi:hypothetical protein TEA_021896 [Camellia sinensis var. sinensis]|uniref:Uncharacterized protein n=1 Tax=Camellia sinensis var. sinensis TaxID=542762 RepID=A0A4S4EEJ1_CAMSN|nr:hypothetical protein TEA_021896 [Camellia sinensis var. sinensis]